MEPENTKLRFKVLYSALGAAACQSGFQYWLFCEMPGKADLITNCAILLFMVVSMPMWRNGVPRFARRNRNR